MYIINFLVEGLRAERVVPMALFYGHYVLIRPVGWDQETTAVLPANWNN